MRDDGRPWRECIAPLVEGEYLRLHQIENATPELLVSVCGGVIKLPTAELMVDYAWADCEKIRNPKADLGS